MRATRGLTRRPRTRVKQGSNTAPAREDGYEPLLSDLVARVAAGEHTAFTVLYEQLAPRIYGLCRTILVEEQHAEDAAHEALVDLWRAAPRYAPTDVSPLNWALTLAHRRAVDHLRVMHRKALRQPQPHREPHPHDASAIVRPVPDNACGTGNGYTLLPDSPDTLDTHATPQQPVAPPWCVAQLADRAQLGPARVCHDGNAAPARGRSPRAAGLLEAKGNTAMSMSDERSNKAEDREGNATDNEQLATDGKAENGTSGMKQAWKNLKDATKTVLDDK